MGPSFSSKKMAAWSKIPFTIRDPYTIQQYPFQADLIWCDGTFNMCFLIPAKITFSAQKCSAWYPSLLCSQINIQSKVTPTYQPRSSSTFKSPSHSRAFQPRLSSTVNLSPSPSLRLITKQLPDRRVHCACLQGLNRPPDNGIGQRATQYSCSRRSFE